MDRLEIVEADITTLDVDAIVNAGRILPCWEVEVLTEQFTGCWQRVVGGMPGRCTDAGPGRRKLQKGII